MTVFQYFTRVWKQTFCGTSDLFESRIFVVLHTCVIANFLWYLRRVSKQAFVELQTCVSTGFLRYFRPVWKQAFCETLDLYESICFFLFFFFFGGTSDLCECRFYVVLQTCVNAGFCFGGISDLSKQAFYGGLVTVAAPAPNAFPCFFGCLLVLGVCTGDCLLLVDVRDICY